MPSDNKGVIVAAVLTPLLVILTAVCISIWLCKHQKGRNVIKEKELDEVMHAM